MDFNWLLQELRELKQARASALAVILFAAVLGWFGASAFNAERIAVLEARLDAALAAPESLDQLRAITTF
jgi:hypothetical protein